MKKYKLFLLLLAMSAFLGGCFREKIVVRQSQDEMKTDYDSFSVYSSDIDFSEPIIKGNINFDGRLSIGHVQVMEKSKIKIIHQIENYKGDFQLILTDNKDYFEEIWSASNKKSIKDTETLDLEKGKYTLKIIGISSKAKINISFDYDNDQIKFSPLGKLMDF